MASTIPDYLDSLPAVYEDEYIRHVRFPQELKVRIDGKTNRGAVLKPETEDNSGEVVN